MTLEIIASATFVVTTALMAMAFSRKSVPGSVLPYTKISTPMPTVKTPKKSGPNVPIPERPSPNDTRLF